MKTSLTVKIEKRSLHPSYEDISDCENRKEKSSSEL